jgi:hypothetical protein
MIISRRNSKAPKCGKCRGELFDKFAVIAGYVYILSNPGIPKLLKIGQTSGSIQRRVDQLSAATGVPTPFVIEAYFVSQSPSADEKQLHDALVSCRVKGREFFDVSLSDALARCAEALHRRPQYVRKIHGPFREP